MNIDRRRFVGSTAGMAAMTGMATAWFWPEAIVPDIADIGPGCHAGPLAFHTSAWPLVGAVFATTRLWMPVTVAAVNVPLTSPPTPGSWLAPAIPDIWLNV